MSEFKLDNVNRVQDRRDNIDGFQVLQEEDDLVMTRQTGEVSYILKTLVRVRDPRVRDVEHQGLAGGVDLVFVPVLVKRGLADVIVITFAVLRLFVDVLVITMNRRVSMGATRRDVVVRLEAVRCRGLVRANPIISPMCGASMLLRAGSMSNIGTRVLIVFGASSLVYSNGRVGDGNVSIGPRAGCPRRA